MFMKKNFALFSLALFSFQSVCAQTAKEVFAKSQKVYENAVFYLDSGKVFQEFYDLPQPFEKAKYFKTAYDKKGRFNFEYYEVGLSNSLMVINRNANNVAQYWWGIGNPTQNNKKLEELLSSAGGVSSRTSIQIPELLLTNHNILGESIFLSTKNPQLDSDETINGVLCFKIKGSDAQGDVTIWISKADFLIKKVMSDQKVSNFRVKSTFDYFSSLPTNLDNGVFEFRPNRKVKM